MKILLIRFSSIGDIVLTSPVIRCLKTQLPEVELHVLTKKAYSHLYEANPHISHVHTLGNGLRKTLNQLKKEDFSHIIDLQKNFRSMRVKLYLRRPSTSFPKLNVKKYLLVRLKLNRMPDLHVVDRYFEAVKPLGVMNDGLGLDFFYREGESTELLSLIPEAGRDYYAFAVGGRHNTKILPAAKLIEVLERIDKPVLLLGGAEDVARAEEVVAAHPKKAINLCGKLSLQQSARALEGAKAVLTNDTGLMHIAAALKKPIVSVWGSTVPAFGMTPYMPGIQQNSVIIENKDLGCRPCSKIGHNKCPKKHFKCMLDLDATKIASALQSFGGASR